MPLIVRSRLPEWHTVFVGTDIDVLSGLKVLSMETQRPRLFFSLFFPVLFVILLWMIWLYEQAFHTSLAEYGIFPRTEHGLIGIFAAPLLHADYRHLLANTLPLLILGVTLFYFYRSIAFRVFGWIYSGQVKITIDGQQPVTATKGYLFDVAPRLSYCMENTGTEPVVFWRVTPAGQMPSYPVTETPTPVKGWKYVQAKITSTGGYDAPNMPFLDFNKDVVAANGKSRDFAFDGHTSAHIIRSGNLAKLPPDTSWGHFHENMVEAWVVIEGSLTVKISGEKDLAVGQTGDVIMAPNERWHRATCTPNTGPCTRLAMTPRLKEGQVHYFQTDTAPGN